MNTQDVNDILNSFKKKETMELNIEKTLIFCEKCGSDLHYCENNFPQNINIL